MAVEVFIPKMSDHMETGEIVEWLVREGDAVEAGQGIVEIMTDKTTAEIESPASGVVKGIRPGVENGAIISVGETIAFIAEKDEDVPSLPPLNPGGETEPESESDVQKSADNMPDATPVARRMAEQFGIDIHELRGSGPGGRIQKEDIIAYRKKLAEGFSPSCTLASPAARRCAREFGVDISLVQGTGPGGFVREVDVNAYRVSTAELSGKRPAEGAFEYIDLTPVQKTTGIRMLESVQNAPQFSLSLSAGMEKLLLIQEILMDRVQAETGRRLSITALLIKVVAASLVQYPRANSSFENGRLHVYRDINIGVAVGSTEGLVVPVIRNVDRKSVTEINAELKVFEEKSKGMKFKSTDLSEGHFTITNLGMYGIEKFNAIVNPPQSAILAVGKVMQVPAGVADGSIVLRKVINFTLTIDHRCMDGMQGAEFLGLIKGITEKPDMFFD